MHPESDDQRPDWLVEEEPAPEAEAPITVGVQADPASAPSSAAQAHTFFLRLNPLAILGMAIVCGLLVATVTAGLTNVFSPPSDIEAPAPVKKKASANEAGDVPVYKGIRRSNDR